MILLSVRPGRQQVRRISACLQVAAEKGRAGAELRQTALNCGKGFNESSRRAAEIMTPVGTIKTGIPVTKNARAKGGSKQHRQPGGPAFLKPNINWEENSVTFFWCDSKGGAVNSRSVQLCQCYTTAQAKADAVVRWDQAERKRIHNHNIQWVVYWARACLLRWMADHMPADVVDNDGNRPTLNEEDVDEDHGELHVLRTCKMVLNEMSQVTSDVDAIMGSREVQWLTSKGYYHLHTVITINISRDTSENIYFFK